MDPQVTLASSQPAAFNPSPLTSEGEFLREKSLVLPHRNKGGGGGGETKHQLKSIEVKRW